MYNNNFFHGIMFHHFHDDTTHTKRQGSISRDDFCKIIDFIGRKNILDSDIFLEKYKKDILKKNEVCLTFDDGIKSQIDIALPVLEDLKIKSIFFPYTSMFEGLPDNLEIYRYFRTNYFSNINDFYEKFYDVLNRNFEEFLTREIDLIKNIKKKFSFYTIEDIEFRLIRDKFLTKKEYENNMSLIMSEKKFNPKTIYSNLFFSKQDLTKIDRLGHTIGLHSHSHPLLMEKLSYENQKKEYEKCLSIISRILNKSTDQIKIMSHPSGSYNDHTLKILSELGIELGFKQIMDIEPEKGMKKINNSFLEIARQDHSDILAKIS